MHFDEAVLAVFIIHYGAFWKLFWFRNLAKKERNGKNPVMHCLLSNNEITIKKQTFDLLFWMLFTLMQNFIEELLSTFATLAVKELILGTIFDNFPLIHEDHSIGNLTGKAHFMCYTHHGHTFFG